MPNWCYTRITVMDEKEKLAKMESLIKEWTSENPRNTDFGNDWLGYVVLNSGVGTVDEGKTTDLNCRGSICGLNLSDTVLEIDTETAWSPMLTMWIMIFNRYLPDAIWYYETEECGNGIQCTDNPDTAGNYYIDSFDNEDVKSKWNATKEEVVAVLQKLLKTSETDLEKLLSEFEKSDYSDGISFRQWEYVIPEYFA